MQSNLYNSKKIDTVDILNINKAFKILKKQKCIVITGVTGQDGSHMVDYLLKNTKDYIIFGGVRRLSIYNHKNIKHVNSDRFHLINFDLTDSHTIHSIFNKLQPSYFINFAAQSYVGSSWDFPEQTWKTNSTSIIHILESMKNHCPKCRLYQAGSSEEFGNVSYSPQDEKHPLKPRSPYGASKVASRVLIKTWRESYNLFAIQGWLFNHEGTRRGEEFVTRKITKNVAYIDHCIQNNIQVKPFSVGNIYANEALFLSRINPNKSAADVSFEHLCLLVKNIKQILKLSIQMGGTTLKDYKQVDGKPGYFKQTLQVYGRGGDSCNECERVLQETRLGQRATVYCEVCQG